MWLVNTFYPETNWTFTSFISKYVDTLFTWTYMTGYKSNQAVSNDLLMDRAWNNWVQMFLFEKWLCNFLEMWQTCVSTKGLTAACFLESCHYITIKFYHFIILSSQIILNINILLHKDCRYPVKIVLSL